jgi:tetratricopeptide (TPR) repeat protein
MDYRLEQLRFELREDPSSRSFFKLGEHLRREGELDEAIEILSSGLEEHDHYVAAWVSLGRAQLDNGDAKEAQISLERSLQLDPENAVASRAMGEAAIVNDDWLTAVKALKRARGLSPQDDTLDERITFVEEHLSELGLLEKPAPVASHRKETPVEVGQIGETPGGEPFAVQAAGNTGVWDDANDVFAAGMVGDDEASETEEVDAGGDEPPPETDDEATEDSGTYVEPPPMTEDDVASMLGGDEPDKTVEPAVIVYEEEPHEAEGAEASENAFIAPEPAPEPEMEQDSEAEPVFESDLEPEPEAEPESETDSDDDDGDDFEHEHEHEHGDDDEYEDEDEDEDEDEQEPATEPEPSLEDEPEPLPESWPDPESDVQTELEKDVDGVPLPTMTLARLAIDQGDLDLAERTLRGVIEREPEHPEAAELLETLIAGPPQAESIAEPKDPAVAKVEALQRWLDAVRLASERLKT